MRFGWGAAAHIVRFGASSVFAGQATITTPSESRPSGGRKRTGDGATVGR
jgi:hypothetical protein